MRAALSLCLLVGFAAVHAAEPPPAHPQPPTPSITAESLLEDSKLPVPPVILDVRTTEEFAAGHVPGAIHHPVGDIEADASSIGVARDQRIVVYCRSGVRAQRAIDALRASGFTHVEHLDGDMLGWEAAGHPLQTP